MKGVKILVLLLFASVCYSCNNYVFSGTYLVSEGLYKEFYKSAGGVYASNNHKCFLTDSIFFRKFIGGYDENHNLQIVESQGVVTVIKRKDGDIERMFSDTTRYVLSELVNGNEFD